MDETSQPWRPRWRPEWRSRAIALGAALLLEALVVALLLLLGVVGPEKKKTVPMAEVTFDAKSEEPETPPAPEQKDEPQAKPSSTPDTPTTLPPAPTSPAEPAPVPLPPVPTPPSALPPPVLPGTAPPTAPAPRARAVIRGDMPGPANDGGPSDSARVGTAPNGEPMYAAAWYRRPTDSELSGYLSTASGPGWGLIACRTVPDFRVEDCVGLDESPQGSQINRAVLAAAWQFRVRPPFKGGQAMVGSWVRIRIDYNLRPAPGAR